MRHILLLEPDRLSASCIVDEFEKRSIKVTVASTAEMAITQADAQKPDAVISELSLPGHSGSEFIYEFRTYTDWKDVPLVVFSSIKPSKKIVLSRDWKLLHIQEMLYKPDCSLQKLGDVVEDAITQ